MREQKAVEMPFSFRGRFCGRLKLIRSIIKRRYRPLRAAVGCKRASSPPFASGGMTIEAALAVPLFLFFFANLLTAFDMLRLSGNMTAALHQTGSRLSEYAYFYRYGLSDVIDLQQHNDQQEGNMDNALSGIPGFAVSVTLSETFVRSSVEDMLGRDYLDHTCLEGGGGAISYLRSNIMADGDIIDLVADYRIRPFMPLPDFDGFPMQSRYYGHAFVGYALSGEAEDDSAGQDVYVFITPTGHVYHMNRECTYLQPSITPIPAGDLKGARNNSGGKYYPCEVCSPSGQGLMFITREGNRFHNSATCPALKRTVYAVTLESVKDHMPACSKCGH